MKREKGKARPLAAKQLFRKRLRTALLAAALLLALAVMGVYASYHNLTSNIEHDEGYYYPDETETQEEITGLEVGLENVDAHSLDDFLRLWAKNDIQKLQDKNVLNLLLCGVDSKNGKGIGGRSDAIILVSINRKDKSIALTSLFRDSYSYIDLSRDPAHPRSLMDRVNSAYSLGGPATLLDTLEDNYKVIIDSYVSVDFKSFPKLIDALGGVTVDVTAKEAEYINRTAPSMGGKFPAGKQVRLSGQQALVFTRIRKLDTDMSRAARQRQVISAIIESARAASPGQILEALRVTLKHVSTNLSEEEVNRLSKDAITQGWLKYEIRQLHSPTVAGSDANPTGFSTYINNKWLWIVDYPRDAQRLQQALYGVTSIELARNREDYLAELFRKSRAANKTTRATTKYTENPATASGASETTGEAESTRKPLFPWLTTKAPETESKAEISTTAPTAIPTTAATESSTTAPL